MQGILHYILSVVHYFYNMQKPAPIGIFDSGYGGLTVLKEIVGRLPQYDYIYLAIMPVRPMVTGHLKLFTIIPCNVYNGFSDRDVR